MKAPSPRALSAQALLKVFHAVCKQRLILFAVDILADERAVTFGVAHLAEDTAPVEVIPSIAHREPFGFPAMSMDGLPVSIDVLERDLTVRKQRLKDVLRRHEATLTVRHRDRMDVTDAACHTHGAFTEATAVGGVRGWWRPMMLNVSVGPSLVISH